MKVLRRFFSVPDSSESAVDVIARKVAEQGGDPDHFRAWIQEARDHPEPGYFGPGDPGRISTAERDG